MTQIMGQGLDDAISDLHINAKKLVETPHNRFQVWEIEEKELDRLNSISDDDWKREWG
jgi:hypothetical protein